MGLFFKGKKALVLAESNFRLNFGNFIRRIQTKLAILLDDEPLEDVCLTNRLNEPHLGKMAHSYFETMQTIHNSRTE